VRTGVVLLAAAGLTASLMACSSHATKTTASASAPVPIFRPNWSLPCLGVIGTVRISAKYGALPEITEELDFLGQSAGLKAIDLNLGSNSAEIIFEKDASKARTTASTALFWAKTYRSPTGVARQRNVVAIFKRSPSVAERGAIFGCMNTSRPAPKKLLREIKLVLTSKRACTSAVYKGPCRQMIVPSGTVSPAHPDYASVAAAQPFEGEYVWESLILHREKGRWKAAGEGTDEVGCGTVPSYVLRDLGFGCHLYGTRS
jgi:hypothetical protein